MDFPWRAMKPNFAKFASNRAPTKDPLQKVGHPYPQAEFQEG
jgi:hypothetical protein